jgi:transmembrane sensor
LVREALTLERLMAMEAGEAAAYFVARRGEGLTSSEEALLTEWLAADDSHELALRRVEGTWDWFAEADGHELIDAMRAHAAAPAVRRWRVPRLAAAAAAVFLLIAAATLLLRTSSGWLNRGAPGEPVDAHAIQYASGRGQIRELALPDGSRMILDADSRLVGRFGSTQRSLELIRGRALFAVAPRPQPFEVVARERRIVAFGTRFDVSLGGDTLRVRLHEGRLSVGPLEPGVRPIILGPGQQYVERNGDRQILPIGRSAGTDEWARGRLHFDDVTLAEAAAEMNRYSRDQIIIRDPEVAALRISGEFAAGEGVDFATSIAGLHPVRPVRRAQGIELVRVK